MGINCIDYATLAVTNAAAVSLVSDADPVLPAAAKGAYITCETADVRWRADGTDPTTSEGHLIDITFDPTLVFDSWSWPGQNWRSVLLKIKFIAPSTSGALKITYYD